MLYAKQIPYDCQESYWEDLFDPETIVLHGNRDFKSHTTDAFDLLQKYLGDACEDRYMQKNGEGYAGYDETFSDIIEDYFPPEGEGRSKYTVEEMKAWDSLLSHYESNDFREAKRRGLELITGKAYTCQEIRGCCQGDWQILYYPSDYGKDFGRFFETLYFNLGSEWMIHSETEDPDGPQDISGYCIYVQASGYDLDEVRNQLSGETGIPESEIKLYSFAEYQQIPYYKAC